MEFDNTGLKPIQVPGFNGIPVNQVAELPTEEDPFNEPFRYAPHGWCGVRLTARERAMLVVMNYITDQPGWDSRIHNEKMINAWKTSALSIGNGLISDLAWRWIIAELRDVSAEYRIQGCTVAFDSGCGVAKADGIVGNDVMQMLRCHTSVLFDSVPRRNDESVIDIADPSMFPLVYGRTEVLSHGGAVSLENVLESSGKGELSQVHMTEQEKIRGNLGRYPFLGRILPPGPVISHELRRARRDISAGYVGPEHRWPHSRRFQWLPCEAELIGDRGTDVNITSYINNLHPTRNMAIYRAIEKLVSHAIPLWNAVLVKGPSGRIPNRVRADGPVFDSELPQWYYKLSDGSRSNNQQLNELREKLRDYLSQPDMDRDSFKDKTKLGTTGLSHLTQAGLQQELENKIVEENISCTANVLLPPRYCNLIVEKWYRLRRAVHPEPGEQFAYRKWKAARAASTRPPVTLERDYRAKGLQIVTKIVSIELTPEEPKYSGGPWRFEGMLNEHIVGTAIYYFDSENITRTTLNISQNCTVSEADRPFFNEHFNTLVHDGVREILDFPSEAHGFMQGEKTQILGSIQTPAGRMIAFPNTLQTSTGSFELKDRTRPGYQRYVALCLVNPDYRICSTRNVPPQRHDWWAEEAYAAVPLEKHPLDIAKLIADEVAEWPMGLAEARALREDLLQERNKVHKLN